MREPRQGDPPRRRRFAGVPRELLSWLLLTTVLVAPSAAQPLPHPPDDPARELPLLLRKLDRTARLLYVTAHPDDEDAGLLSLLTHGLGVETALLTLTRGEGGQNEIGTELFHALGVLRSRELEAASRYHGALQRFTRAYEFGYSFSVEETYEKWHRESILRDVVRVIRELRPDVIVTLPLEGEGGGQHHQASARITLEAFDVAASERWPELGAPHRTRRLFRVIWRGTDGVENLCEIPLHGYDPLLGCSYAELGERARALHKCQGMARLHDPFPRRSARLEWVRGAGEEPRALDHPFEALPEPLLDREASGGETPFGRDLRVLARALRERYRPEGPEEIAADLLLLRDRVVSELDGETDPGARVRLETLRRRAAGALALALGMRRRAVTDRRTLAAGETLEAQVFLENQGPRPLEVDVELQDAGGKRLASLPAALILPPGERRMASLWAPLPEEMSPTIPSPLPARGDALPEQAVPHRLLPSWSAFQVAVILRLAERRLHLPPIPLETLEIRRDLHGEIVPQVRLADPQVVPEPSVRPRNGVLPLPVPGGGGTERRVSPPAEIDTTVSFLVSSLRGGEVDITLDLPEGWSAAPATRRVRCAQPGVEQPVEFSLRMSPRAAAALEGIEIVARARPAKGGRESHLGYQAIDYPHIRPGALLHEARVRVVPFHCSLPRGRRVGYVAGVGDEVPRALEVLGIETRHLRSTDLLEGDLNRLDVIITGVRAYKVRSDLKEAHPRLMAWVAGGGTLLVQYNKLELNGEEGRAAGATGSPYAPFPGTRVGRRRVTVEESPVRILHPEQPVFHRPNRIGPADWEGWVQERGLYFLDLDDPRYLDLLELSDPWPYNRGPQGGSLVVAPVGEGHWVYIGLGLFRQLPAGVPGAYRLLANLLALGDGNDGR